MAKMYYTEVEAAGKLNLPLARLSDLARQGKLHVYADGTNRMYKVVEVDAMAVAGVASRSHESDIQLAPADSSGTRESLSLADSTASTAKPKEDTVITSEGISIFDDEELEIEAADPMAKTQIAPSLEDQISLDGVGSGSGLLDLTRESDDTSLGNEVLDHIDVDSEVPSVGGTSDIESIGASAEVAEPAAAAPEMMMVLPDRADPTAGAFTGLLGVGTAIMLFLSIVALAVVTGRQPSYFASLGDSLLIVVGVFVLLAAVAGVVGFVMGKGAAQRSAATR